jgi:lactobin A/cerein 7B family class IIb bacteriocin
METKKLSFQEMEEIEGGGWPGRCFFAIPLAILEAGSSPTGPIWAVGRISYCWNT